MPSGSASGERMPEKKRMGRTPAHALISQRSQETTAEVDGPAAPKSTPSASRAACLVSSGRGDPWGGVRILRGRPVPMRSSQVASTTSSPMPSPGSATMVFMAIRAPSFKWEAYQNPGKGGERGSLMIGSRPAQEGDPRAYTRISADCHIDMPWMPADLFTSNASAALRDRMPYVTDGPDGPTW